MVIVLAFFIVIALIIIVPLIKCTRRSAGIQQTLTTVENQNHTVIIQNEKMIGQGDKIIAKTAQTNHLARELMGMESDGLEQRIVTTQARVDNSLAST